MKLKQSQFLAHFVVIGTLMTLASACGPQLMTSMKTVSGQTSNLLPGGVATGGTYQMTYLGSTCISNSVVAPLQAGGVFSYRMIMALAGGNAFQYTQIQFATNDCSGSQQVSTVVGSYSITGSRVTFQPGNPQAWSTMTGTIVKGTLSNIGDAFTLDGSFNANTGNAMDSAFIRTN